MGGVSAEHWGMTTLVFETHSWSEDNDLGRASGWFHGRLSPRGRELARELGTRRREGGFAVVFTSDLSRAVETATLAFGTTSVPILHDWRLRECNYGALNGQPVRALHRDRRRHLDEPYPNGESWRQAVARVGRFVDDVKVLWPGRRVLVIGHVATRWGFDHLLRGVPLEVLIDEDFGWREGWTYDIP